MSAVYSLINYLGSLEELRDVFNGNFNFSIGDAEYWEDYATSPIFPVSEQPESDNFYILYNFSESHEQDSWWHVEASMSIYVASNKVHVIEEASSIIRKALSDYEFAASRVNAWASGESLTYSPINWIRFLSAGPIMSESQENGVYGRVINIQFNYTDC